VFDVDATLDRFRLRAALEVRTGETLALVGPSGAGKTTCLALIAGLLAAETGRIVCDGEIWCDTTQGIHRPPEARRVGLLYQEYALFPHMTVGENVRYGPLARGRGRGEAREAAALWLERLGIQELEPRFAGELSGGQRQRVALARALAVAPKVLLLDEPFGSLDVSTRSAVRSELRAFLESCDLPTILVTHDAADAVAFGDRIAVLEAGRLVQVGSRETLLHEPRTPFVAQLGGVNLTCITPSCRPVADSRRHAWARWCSTCSPTRPRGRSS
jgi:molybdate transport system ATP-binding protein